MQVLYTCVSQGYTDQGILKAQLLLDTKVMVTALLEYINPFMKMGTGCPDQLLQP